MKALYDWSIHCAREQALLCQEAQAQAHDILSTGDPDVALVWQKQHAHAYEQMTIAREHWSQLVAERDEYFSPAARFSRALDAIL